jgi:ubiquinone/menaquinone biosynthesis C-methylase UbiE
VRRVLDLGAGDGVLTAALLTRFPQAMATLVDFSTPMLDAARERLAAVTPPPRFVEADFGVPAWVATVADRAPFDVVVSGFAIHHQPDARKRHLYGELFDLLALGGVFVNVEHVASPAPWLGRVFDDLMVDALFAFQRRSGTFPRREEVAAAYEQRPDQAANILAPVAEQCAWLRACGFEDVDCFFKLFELAVFGGRKPVADI